MQRACAALQRALYKLAFSDNKTNAIMTYMYAHTHSQECTNQVVATSDAVRSVKSKSVSTAFNMSSL